MAPKFQIRADVLVYALLVGGSTAATLAWTNYYGVSEEEKLKILREKYPVQIKKNEDQRQQMQAFFDNMKDGNNSELDGKFNAVLKGGKAEMKRQYPPGVSEQTPVVNPGTAQTAMAGTAGTAKTTTTPATHSINSTATSTASTSAAPAASDASSAPSSKPAAAASGSWGWGWWW